MTRTKAPAQATEQRLPSKLDLLIAALRRKEGASTAELSALTSWQTHSVRGALAGTLKKKGHATTSEVIDGVRRYRLSSK